MVDILVDFDPHCQNKGHLMNRSALQDPVGAGREDFGDGVMRQPSLGGTTRSAEAILNRNLFFVKEHTGLFRAASNYDVLDPETGEELLWCRENRLGFFTRILRFTDYKRMTPFHLEVGTPTGEPLFEVKRRMSLLLSNVEVCNPDQERVGGFKQKLLSIGGAFDVLSPSGQTICHLKGKWTSWEFQFLSPDGTELGRVTKKWAGLGKELFTSADNYVLQISDSVPPGNPVRLLIMAAVFCVDLVLKE
jgi:uncharacterized protein YxjI